MREFTVKKAQVVSQAFNPDFDYPYHLSPNDFRLTMIDIYDFIYDLNEKSVERGWGRFEDWLQNQALSNVLSNMLNTTLGKYTRSLVVNTLPNGHPDLILRGVYPNNRAVSADEGVEVKATKNIRASVDMHSDWEQDLCTFVYVVDRRFGVPFSELEPLRFVGVFLGHVKPEDYRLNARGARGTKTAALNADGIAKYRQHWIYLTNELRNTKWCKKELDLPLIVEQARE